MSKSFRLAEIARETIDKETKTCGRNSRFVATCFRIREEHPSLQGVLFDGRSALPLALFLAKEVELAGWDYPRHLAGRLFSVIVHGDVEGAENVRHSIADWLRFMKLSPAGPSAELDRYIGYWKPYATSHDELDADETIQEEVRNAARSLAEAVVERRSGRFRQIGIGLEDPRQK